MRVLVLGGGGREHALAWRLHRDPEVTALVLAPGNPGMAELGPCVPLDLGRPDDALELARRERIDLTVVGPEAALDRGIGDTFRIDKRAIVGPSKRSSALESSKAFAKDFMTRHGIPTARYLVADDPAATLRTAPPVTVKSEVPMMAPSGPDFPLVSVPDAEAMNRYLPPSDAVSALIDTTAAADGDTCPSMLETDARFCSSVPPSQTRCAGAS